jgi:hypothetical protein
LSKVQCSLTGRHFRLKRGRRVKVDGSGNGLVSHAGAVLLARRAAREAAWAAGAAPDLTMELIIDADATIVVSPATSSTKPAVFICAWTGTGDGHPR